MFYLHPYFSFLTVFRIFENLSTSSKAEMNTKSYFSKEENRKKTEFILLQM